MTVSHTNTPERSGALDRWVIVAGRCPIPGQDAP
jgi:hypothetical protein